MLTGKRASSWRGAYKLPVLDKTVGVSACLLFTALSVNVSYFRIISDCEGCAWTISTNLVSTDSGGLGLPCRNCFVVRSLELVPIAPLLRFRWCVLNAAGFRFIFSFFYFERALPTACIRYSYSSLALFTSILFLMRRLFFAYMQEREIVLRPFSARRQNSLFISGCVQASSLSFCL